MKRILFITHSLTIGGTEQLITQISEAIQDQFEVGIVCLDHQGALWERCEALGIRLWNLEREAGFDFSLITKLKAVIKEFRPTIVHAHQYTPFFYTALTKLLGFRHFFIIFTEHGRHFPDIVSFKRKLINKCLVLAIDKITACCQFSKKALIENEDLPADRIEVIYNGLHKSKAVDPENRTLLTREEARKFFKLQPDDYVVGYLGSFREVKNPLFLLESFAQYKKIDTSKNSNSKLLMIGDGSLRSLIEDFVNRNNMNNDVLLPGAIIAGSRYLKAFDLFVLPSQSEACSLALLEAMDAQVPVVVTNRGGSPEIVQEGENGYIVECDDVDSLSRVISSVHMNKEETQEYVTSAKETVDTQFNFDDMLEKYKQLYNELS